MTEHNHWLHKDVVINAGENWGDNEDHAANHFSILGMPRDGTFAEFLCVNTDRLCLKPLHLSYEEAAAFPLAGLTGFRALFIKGNCWPSLILILRRF